MEQQYLQQIPVGDASDVNSGISTEVFTDK